MIQEDPPLRVTPATGATQSKYREVAVKSNLSATAAELRLDSLCRGEELQH